MTLDQIEELIRKYLATGVTVVVILTGVQPATGVSASPSSTRSPSPPTRSSVTPSASRPTVVVLGPDGSTTATGAAGSDPADPADNRAADPTAAVGAPTAAPATGKGSAGSDQAGSAGTGSAGTGSAADTFGWGTPDRVEDFSTGTGAWDLYNGPGHDGKGRRSPSAVSLADGVMTITGSPDGTTEGMAWDPGQKFGRWEARVKSPAGDSSYHAVLLLWPDAENWPAGGEVDFMEISDGTRQTTDMFLHYGADNAQKSGSVQLDATQWHDWAVEWTPKGITAYVDGTRWWNTTDTSVLPPGPMHMTIQLDWFPEAGAVKQTQMSVDWVRRYPVGT